MKTKQILTGLLALTLIASLAAGCGGGASGSGREGTSPQTSSAAAEQGVDYNPPGVMPIVKERIGLTIFAPSDDNNNTRADNLQTKELEEMTGIDITWQIAPSDNIKEKMNLMFASGDMTDIVFTGVAQANRLDMATEALLGAQGLIIPLNKYFDTVSVGYKNALEKLEGMREYITTPDGNIYSLPNVDGSLHVQYSCKMWINTVWLDNLGLEMPATTDEFYNAMKAFKEQDANGNGDPNDEIPLSTCKSGAGTQIDGFLMNAFELTPEGTKLYVDNGRIVFSPVQDGYREGLRYLNRLYSEGLINPESFTQDRQNQVNVNENGPDCVIGAFLAQHPSYAADLATMPNSKKWEQYQVLPPLKGPSGKVVASWNPYTMYQTGMTFITSSCKYPEAAFRLIDYLATPEGTMRSAFGIEGEHYAAAEPGELGLDGQQARIKKIGNADITAENISWGQLAGLVRLPEDTVCMVTNPDPYAEGVAPMDGRQVVMYRASKEYERVRQPLESVLPSLYHSAEEIEELSLVKTTVTDYSNESAIRFITGDLNIDRDWDNYAAQLRTIGLDQYLRLLQDAYDASAFAN